MTIEKLFPHCNLNDLSNITYDVQLDGWITSTHYYYY